MPQHGDACCPFLAGGGIRLSAVAHHRSFPSTHDNGEQEAAPAGRWAAEHWAAEPDPEIPDLDTTRGTPEAQLQPWVPCGIRELAANGSLPVGSISANGSLPVGRISRLASAQRGRRELRAAGASGVERERPGGRSWPGGSQSRSQSGSQSGSGSGEEREAARLSMDGDADGEVEEDTVSPLGSGALRSRLLVGEHRRLSQRRCRQQHEAPFQAEAGTGGCAGSASSRSSLASEVPAFRRRRTGLPTQRLQRAVEECGGLEHEEQKERPPGGVDLMLVLPVGPQPGDDEPLPEPGPDQANPAPGSASWLIKQMVCDDEVFTASSKRTKVSEGDPPRGRWNARPSAAPQYFRPSVVVEYPLMKLCYSRAQQAETKGQLRERVMELLLRYLLSAKCCFQVRVFLGCDGRSLFLGVCADELVLRGHADALGYHVQLDYHVARGLLRGSFRREELHPAYVRYDLEEENRFRSLHGHSPFKAHFDTFGEAVGGSIFRGVDRVRIIERVVSRVFNLEGMLEHGLLAARYACHSSAEQRALARSWTSARLLHSPDVPLGAVRDYLGEAATFRVCFLSFLTRALLPVVAVALAAGLLPDGLLSRTARSMQLCVVLGIWGAAFFRLWLRTERHWAMAWGVDAFERREAVRSSFLGAWGVSAVDRYTIVKVAPWARQLYRRTATFLATCLFNALLLGLVVALFSYQNRLLRSGHARLAQAVYYLNASSMLLFDTLWGYLAISLTDFDNYATDSEYTEQVIQRIFVTRFINSFASLFYIAFVKQFIEVCDDGYGCYSELAKQLRVLFGASMARSVFRPAFSYAWFRTVHSIKLRRARKRQSLSGYTAVGERCQQSSLEVQASMPENTLSEDVEDVMDLIIELGFVMFFGCIAPEIIWIFCISNLIRIRTWGWKLLFAVRRPFPASAAGLGSLNKVVCLISASSVWCNIFLCLMLNCHTYGTSSADVISWLEQLVGTASDSVSDGTVSWKSLLAVFLVLERTIFLARGAIDYCIINRSGSVELEEKRRDAMTTAYYKVIMEDANVEESQGMSETSAETLQPMGVDVPGRLSARAWYPVGVERILKACRQVKPEAEAEVPAFTPRDPGFEYPWNEQDSEDDDDANTSPPDSPRF